MRIIRNRKRIQTAGTSDSRLQAKYVCNVCGKTEKNYKNELIHKTETDFQTSKTNLQLPKGKSGRGGINQEFGINIYTLLYIK